MAYVAALCAEIPVYTVVNTALNYPGWPVASTCSVHGEKTNLADYPS